MLLPTRTAAVAAHSSSTNVDAIGAPVTTVHPASQRWPATPIALAHTWRGRDSRVGAVGDDVEVAQGAVGVNALSVACADIDHVLRPRS